jgi:opacity protein-like surface antigen
LLSLIIAPAVAPVAAAAATDGTVSATPKWALEFKGGIYKPDLPDYSTFYGSDDNDLWAIAGAYRFYNWLELGLELGYSKDTGTGSLPDQGAQGGKVEYTLVPVQLFFNLRYDVAPDQLFVPYVGAGLAMAWYQQQISQQSDREGSSDIGGAARAGLQLSLNRLTPDTVTYSRGKQLLKSYVFLEAQYFSTEKDGTDLGGDAYLLGLRLEF